MSIIKGNIIAIRPVDVETWNSYPNIFDENVYDFQDTFIIESSNRGRYAYGPATEANVGMDEYPRWRERVIKAHTHLMKWVHHKDEEEECPAYICWNCEGKPMLNISGDGHFASGGIQPLVIWNTDAENAENWYVDPYAPTTIQ